MFKRTCLLASVCSLLLAPCLVAADDHVLRYAGATTLQRSFMPEAARIFQGETGIRFQIEGGNTDPGIRALLAGEVDVAGAGRRLTAQEKQQGLVEHFLGWDTLAVVVKRGNPVEMLSRDQLHGIFSGEIRNWREVGGRDESIIVVTSPKGSGIRAAVQELILGGKPFTAGEVVSGVAGQADQQVAMLPAAITAVSASMIDHQQVKTVGVDGFLPNAANVAAGRYPLAKPLCLITRGQPKGALEKFLAFAKGPRGQAILARNFVPASAP